MRNPALSVSTSGSRGVKPVRWNGASGSAFTFSIHEWIEGSETSSSSTPIKSRPVFQYPRVDRGE